MLDRLTASRLTDEPTELYRAPSRREGLAWAAGVALLAVLAAFGFWWFWPTGSGSGPETLLGVELGESSDAIGSRIAFGRISKGDPWKSAESVPLGGVLQPADLGDDPEKVTARWSSEGLTCGIFMGERLVALITSQTGGRTSRGVQVGSTFNQLSDRYPEDHYTRTAQVDGMRVDVIRYDTLGVGFEIRGKTVTRITLYRASP
jgi:hypothetical protein